MVQETNNDICQYPSTLQELLDDMQSGRYSHLQFILNRKKHHNLGLGQKYLVVNNIGFGLYELNSVDYKQGIIKMIFTNPDTGNPAEITLDVRNKHPETYLINWTDIEDMVYAERNFDCADDELLELEDE
jgi:hypothetical protein